MVGAKGYDRAGDSGLGGQNEGVVVVDGVDKFGTDGLTPEYAEQQLKAAQAAEDGEHSRVYGDNADAVKKLQRTVNSPTASDADITAANQKLEELNAKGHVCKKTQLALESEARIAEVPS